MYMEQTRRNPAKVEQHLVAFRMMPKIRSEFARYKEFSPYEGKGVHLDRILLSEQRTLARKFLRQMEAALKKMASEGKKDCPMEEVETFFPSMPLFVVKHIAWLSLEFDGKGRASLLIEPYTDSDFKAIVLPPKKYMEGIEFMLSKLPEKTYSPGKYSILQTLAWRMLENQQLD